MSLPNRKQSAQDEMMSFPGIGVTFAAGTTVPTDAKAGFAPGCIFLKVNGTIGSQFYINEGSNTSCDFNAISLGGISLAGLTATATELNTMHNQTLATEAGAGITGGVGAVYESSVQLSGGIYTTRILIDLTGLASSTTDLDIIGVGASAAHIGQITAARNGTIFSGRVFCLETPAGGADDIDLYMATEATGVFDAGIGTLAETALLTKGGAWAAGDITLLSALPTADKYLYLTGGEAGTAATYTAGQFLIELLGV